MKKTAFMCVAAAALLGPAFGQGPAISGAAARQDVDPASIDAGALIRSAQRVNSAQLHAIADALRAEQFFVSGRTPVTLFAGDRVIRIGAGFGDVPKFNAPLPDGIYWNAGPGHLQFALGENPLPSLAESLPPNSILVVGGAFVPTRDRLTDGGGASSCSVTCGSGYYSCCTRLSGGTTWCRCIKSNSLEAGDCEAGGPGSTGCEISN